MWGKGCIHFLGENESQNFEVSFFLGGGVKLLESAFVGVILGSKHFFSCLREICNFVYFFNKITYLSLDD